MNPKSVVLFGAGHTGEIALLSMKKKGINVLFFIDNNSDLWGKKKEDVEIISLNDFIKKQLDAHILVTGNYEMQVEIESQIKKYGYKDYSFFIYDKEELPRLLSNCTRQEREDVILYHALKEESDVFYIDIGCNDPTIGSVTKLLREFLQAHGINVEPLKELWNQIRFERKNDINLNLACGQKDGKADLCVQGGLSTLLESNMLSDYLHRESVFVMSLKSICDQYVGQRHISLLKIDVEGFEKEVLLGADFKKYRPDIIVIESVSPMTGEENYDEWEYILIEYDYHYVLTQGVNRYYVSSERLDLVRRLEETKNIEDYYNIRYVFFE